MGLENSCSIRFVNALVTLVYRRTFRESSSYRACSWCFEFDLAGIKNRLLNPRTSRNGREFSLGNLYCRLSRVADTMASSRNGCSLQGHADEKEVDTKVEHIVNSIDREQPLLEESFPNPTHSQPVLSAPSPSQEKHSNLSKRARKKLLRLEKVRGMKKKSKHQTQSDMSSEAGFGKEIYAETEYYFENGLRKVYPYYYTFSTYVKRRWIGQTVLDVFCQEFCADDEVDYKRVIEEGRLTVNGQKVSPDWRLKDNELLCHRTHRHENAVAAGAIEVIANTEDVLVINKPASIPCHPCGRYRHNSVVFIVGKELGYYNLRNIYRLDRLTSGVLILGKTEAKSKELEKQVAQRLMKKTYVARVAGCFPEDDVEVKQPLACASPKLGLWHVHPEGKPSHTTFRRLSFNGHSSLVQCIPHTGRTHQIRVHLQFLGHPIVNDPFYNSTAWGPDCGKGGDYGSTLSEVVARLMEKHNPRHWEDGENPLYHQRLAELSAKQPSLSMDRQANNRGGMEAAAGREKTCDTGAQESDMGALEARESLSCGSNPRKGGLPVVSCSDGRVASIDQELPELEGCQEPPVIDRCGPTGSKDAAEPPEKKQRVDDEQPSTLFPTFQPSKWIPDVECDRCRIQYRDPGPSELVLYLHALSYEGPGWKYEAPLPNWATQDWTE